MEGLRRRFKLYSKRDESLEPHQDDDDALPEDPVPREQGNAAQIKNVAKAMFSAMCEGFDVEVITKANIDNAIQNLVLSKVTPTKSLIQSSIYAASSKKLKESIRKLLNDAMQKSKNNEVTCDLFCDRALQYSDGNISLMDMLEGEIPDVDIKKQDRANLGNFFDYPVHTMRVMKKEILKTVERRGVKWLWSTFSTKHFYLLIGAYFLPMMTLQFIISSVTTALFTGAILAMLLITIQIAVNSEKYQIRMDYLSLFQYFNGPELRIDIKMPKSDLVYYGNFFLALVVALGTSGFSNKDVINSELLVVLCVFVAFVIFLQFDLYESKLAYLLIVAKAPSWVLLVLEKLYLLLGYPSDDLLSWSRLLLPGMGFSISVVSLLQIAAHLYLIVSQLKDLEWKTFFSFHGPHLLFLCWLVLCRNFVSEADPATMLKITTTIALIPVYTFVFLSSPLYFLYFYGFTPPFFYSFFFVALVALFGVVLLYLYVYMKSLWIAISLDHVLLLVMVLLIPLLLYLSSWYASMYQPPPLPPVTTDQYVEYCGPGNWNDGNMIQTQINCFHLKDRVFSSQGEIESIRISKVVNGMSDSINFLPSPLQAAITCYAGDCKPMCGDRKDMSTCINKGCHFMQHQIYTFEIILKVLISGGTEALKAKLSVSGKYKDFLMKLTSGSRIEFSALFVEGMGSDQLTLKAEHLSYGTEPTESTRGVEKEEEKEMIQNILHKLSDSLQHIVFVILEILVGYLP